MRALDTIVVRTVLKARWTIFAINKNQAECSCCTSETTLASTLTWYLFVVINNQGIQGIWKRYSPTVFWCHV